MQRLVTKYSLVTKQFGQVESPPDQVHSTGRRQRGTGQLLGALMAGSGLGHLRFAVLCKGEMKCCANLLVW